jgi:hypothetical protein
VPSDADVASVQRGVDLCLIVDIDVPGGMDLTLDSAAETDVAVDMELADEAVARA